MVTWQKKKKVEPKWLVDLKLMVEDFHWMHESSGEIVHLRNYMRRMKKFGKITKWNMVYDSDHDRNFIVMIFTTPDGKEHSIP